MNYRIYLLAVVAFMSGFDENLMIGLLSPVAESLKVSIAAAGQLTTIFSLTFGIAAPILVVLCAGWERRRLLLLALFIYFVANLLGGIAPNYTVLFVARIIQAASCALICMLATTIATRLVPIDKRGRALGTVVMGISASLVLGIPAGIWIGSWRLSFILVAIIALVLLGCVRYCIPPLAATGALPLRAYLAYCRRPTLFFAQLATLLAMASYFALFGYLTPYLGIRFGLNAETIALSYMVLGIAGIVGSYFGGWLADLLGPIRALCAVYAVFMLAAITVFIAQADLHILAFGLLIWTLTVWAMGPIVQNYLILRAPDRVDVSIGFNISSIQLGIALGLGLGGVVIKQWDLAQIPLAGLLIGTTTLICIAVSLSQGSRQSESVASSQC